MYSEAIQKAASDSGQILSTRLNAFRLPDDPFARIVGHLDTITELKRQADAFIDRHNACITQLLAHCGDTDRGILLTPKTAALLKAMPQVSSLLLLHGDYGDGKTSLMMALSEYVSKRQAEPGCHNRTLMLIKAGDQAQYYLSTRKQIDAALATHQKESQMRMIKGRIVAGGVGMVLGYIMANYAYFAAKLIPSANRMIVCQNIDTSLLDVNDQVKYATLTPNMMGPHGYVTHDTLYQDKPLFTMAFNFSYAFQLFNDLLLACQGFLLLWVLGNVSKHQQHHAPYILQGQGVSVVVGGLSAIDLMGIERPNSSIPQQRLTPGKAATALGSTMMIENFDELSKTEQSHLLQLMGENVYSLPGDTHLFPFLILILATTNHVEKLIPDIRRSNNTEVIHHPSLIPDPDHAHAFHLMQLVHQKSQRGDLPRLTDGAWGVLLRHIQHDSHVRVNRTLWMALSGAPQVGQCLDGAALSHTVSKPTVSNVDHAKLIHRLSDAYCDRLRHLSKRVSDTVDGLWISEITPELIQPIPALMVVGDDASKTVREIGSVIQDKLNAMVKDENVAMGLVAFPCALKGVKLKLMNATHIHRMQTTQHHNEQMATRVQQVANSLLVSYSVLFLLTEAYKGWVVNDLVQSHDACLIPGVSSSDTAIIKSLKHSDAFHSLIYLFKVILTALANWMSTVAIATTLHRANQWVTQKEDKKPVVLLDPSVSFSVRGLKTGIIGDALDGQWIDNPLLPPQKRLMIGDNVLNWASVLTHSGFGYASKDDQMRVASMITERSTQTAHGNCPFVGTFVLGVSCDTFDSVSKVLKDSGRVEILRLPPSPSPAPPSIVSVTSGSTLYSTAYSIASTQASSHAPSLASSLVSGDIEVSSYPPPLCTADSAP